MNPPSAKQLFTSPPPSDRILINQKGKQQIFESGNPFMSKNFSLIELGSVSDFENASQSQRAKKQTLQQNYNKLSQGFSNEVWKRSALRIIYFITKFISYILTNSGKFRFSYINRNMFNFINDQSSSYEFYIKNGYIKQKYKLDIYVNIFILNFLKKSKIKQNLKVNKFNCIQSQCQKIKVIYPNSALKIIWDIIVLSLLLLNIMYIPLKVSFKISFTSDPFLYVLFDQLPTYIFILEIILNFFTAYYAHGVLITDASHIAHHYLKKGFLFDFIVLIPFIISKFQISYIEFILLLRLKRVVLIFENLVETLNLRENFASIIDVSTLIFFFIFLSHLIACSWHFLGVIEHDFGQKLYNYKQNRVDHTWITYSGIQDSEWYTKYINSFYWSCITTLTVGYGDLIPQTDAEKIFVIFIALISSVVFGYTISNIGQIFSEISESKKKQKAKMTLISKFIRKRGLNKELQTKVKKFFEYYYKIDQDKDKECQEMMTNLTNQLQIEVKTDLYRSMFKKSNFLRKTFSDEYFYNQTIILSFLNCLCIYVKEKQFIPEETILEQGEISQNLYFVMKGETQALVIEKDKNNLIVKKQNQRKLNKSIKGDILAEKFILLQQKIPYQVKSVSFTKVSYISINDFHHLLSLYPLEREKYFQAKHHIDMKNQSQKYFACPFCFQNHQFENCSFVQYVPNLRQILSKDDQRKNYRNEKNLLRQSEKSFKFRVDRKTIQENAVLYALDNDFLNPDQLDTAFQNKFGVIIPYQNDNNGQQLFSQSSLKLHQQQNQQNNQDLNQQQQESPANTGKRKSNRGFSKIQLKLPSSEKIFSYEKSLPTPKEKQNVQSQETSPKYDIGYDKNEETQTYSVKKQMKRQYLKMIQEDTLTDLDQWQDYQFFFPSCNISTILEEIKLQQMKLHMQLIKIRRIMNSSNRITFRNLDSVNNQKKSRFSFIA